MYGHEDEVLIASTKTPARANRVVSIARGGCFWLGESEERCLLTERTREDQPAREVYETQQFLIERQNAVDLTESRKLTAPGDGGVTGAPTTARALVETEGGHSP
jgi:hypothetical protein